MVDHVHFQYNGLLLGILLLSLAAHLSGLVLLGGLLFAILINSKHLYLVLAPVQFVYTLFGWVWGAGWLKRLAMMASVVMSTCAVSLGPFVANGSLKPMLTRCAGGAHVARSFATHMRALLAMT
jgi:alpha-1,3-glucosyltransferase